jgi:hypothetical protein
MAKKTQPPVTDRHIYLAVFVVVGVGMVVFAYLMGVQNTLITLEDVLPY